MNDVWIKVSLDSLPKSFGVIIWTWDGKDVSHWRINAQVAKTKEELLAFFNKYGITHWMNYKIPEPPK